MNTITTLLTLLLLVFNTSLNAQFFKKLQQKVEQKLQQKTEKISQKTEQEVDEKIDKKIDDFSLEKSKKETTEDKVLTAYRFTAKTKVLITTSEKNQSYKISYLLNPDEKYAALYTKMNEVSDEDVDGISIVILDGNSTQILVESEGVKMKIPKSMMQDKMSNPARDMEKYNYNNLQKTNKQKSILGYQCYEYIMSDAKMEMNLWVAPSLQLPNWFMNSAKAFTGHVLEYTVKSNDGTIHSKTIAVEKDINLTINPNEYKKMF